MQDEEFNKKDLFNVILNNAKMREQWEKEVGDFANKNGLTADMYSNDLRHQYAAAITARNLGENKARFLGNMNEVVNSSGGNAIDQQIDKFNNEIGIRYGLQKPFLTKQQLLEQLYEDHHKNRKARIQELGY